MGQFSWLDCKTNEQILDDVERDCYLLIPKKFGGGHIKETCYNGYGDFGGKDVYDLVAEWNREYIPTFLERKKAHPFADLWKPVVDAMMPFHRGEPITCKVRDIGILLACEDEDNAVLAYPIKITHDPRAIYEECAPSLADPDQGWLMSEIDDDDATYNVWQENLLSDILKDHYGHHVEIAVYGDRDDPACVCLECTDCNEVLLDGSIYTICGREDI